MTPTKKPISTADDPVLALLQQFHPPQLAAEIQSTRAQHKPLPLHPTATTHDDDDARDLRRRTRAAKQPPRRKPQPLSAKEKRKLRVHALPTRNIPYETFRPLHALWLRYVRELMALGGGGAAAALAGKMASGDLHGAMVEVVRSRAVDRVGIRGIVVKETRGVLEIATEAGRVKTVPKEFTIFRIEVPMQEEDKGEGKGKGEEEKEKKKEKETGKVRTMVFDLHGSQLMFRAPDRAGRKFKAKSLLDL